MGFFSKIFKRPEVINTTYDDHYARWSYEQLLLNQPQITFTGLWRLDFDHYIVCPNLDNNLSKDGKNLKSWFDYNCRVVTAPVELVSECPKDAERVPERSAAERALLVGSPRNHRSLLVDLGLLLSPNFPPFALDTSNAKISFITNQPLTSDEVRLVNNAYTKLGYFISLSFIVDSSREISNKKFRYDHGNGDIDLIPSRFIKGKYNRPLEALVEADEEFWVDNRGSLLSTFHKTPNKLLPPKWGSKKNLGCIIDATVSKPENIRSYLTLYDTVYLSLPIKEYFVQNCSSLGVTPEELLKLVQTNRVKLLLPQSVDRYPGKWLSEVAESSSENLLLSRRLASITISDGRRRMPLLFAPLSSHDRHILLNTIINHAESIVGSEKSTKFIQFVSELGDSWANSDWSVHSRGAMGTAPFGIGGVAGSLYHLISGRDLRLELWSAAHKVEWGAALNAHVFPDSSNDYDETNACNLVAGIYGLPLKKSLVQPNLALSAISNLLSIDNQAPVVDFATEFVSSDIKRLRKLILRLSTEHVNSNSLSTAIGKFNSEVRHYEKRPDLLNNINIIGLFSAGLVASGKLNPDLQKIIPLAGIMAGFIVNRIITEIPRFSSTSGHIIDFLNSILTGRNNPEAVLVSRAKKDISRFKK